MAHAAKISTLTDGLIQSITSPSDAHQLKQYREHALKAFKSQQHARVNQFDVQSRLGGLEEKFVVFNKDPLADALRTRLDELARTPSQWTPEILALLLALSDRPVQNTNLSILDPADGDRAAVPQLTWADIIADDPLNEEGIWDDVSFASDSDADYDSVSEDSVADHTVSTHPSSLADEDIAAFARSFIISKNDVSITTLQSTRQQLRPGVREGAMVDITAYQAIREALLLLHGLPTDLFMRNAHSEVSFRATYRTGTCSQTSLNQVMHSFATIGSRLDRLQIWSISAQTSPVVQRLQSSVLRELRKFRSSLSAIEQRFLTEANAVVSLIEVLSSVQHCVKPLYCLYTAIFKNDSSIEDWAVLDCLYQTVCELQLTGAEQADLILMTRIFLDCFEVYLLPVHVWMAEGRLRDKDQGFFVLPLNQSADLGSLWHSSVALSRNENGAINAPTFMLRAAPRVFNAGRAVMFLAALRGAACNNISCKGRKNIDVDSVLRLQDQGFLPFSGVLDDAIEQWVDDHQQQGIVSLRQVLLSQCGLNNTLDAIDHLFMARDGSVFQQFADELFARFDRQGLWSDRYVLTDLAQNTLGSTSFISEAAISARLLSNDDSPKSLYHVVIDYAVPVPVRNVIADLNICQQAFTAHLQAYRAEYLLMKTQSNLTTMKSQHDHRVSETLSLRHRLVWFTRSFRGYLGEVTAMSMRDLRVSIDRASDMDGMWDAYTQFQRNLEGRLLLDKKLRPLYQSLMSILDMCEDVARLWLHLSADGDKLAAIPIARRRRFRRSGGEGMSDESSDDETTEETSTQSRPLPSVRALLEDYERQLHFFIAGLRSLSRAGGEPAWTLLAERLHLGLQDMKKM